MDAPAGAVERNVWYLAVADVVDVGTKGIFGMFIFWFSSTSDVRPHAGVTQWETESVDDGRGHRSAGKCGVAGFNAGKDVRWNARGFLLLEVCTRAMGDVKVVVRNVMVGDDARRFEFGRSMKNLARAQRFVVTVGRRGQRPE